MSNSDELQLAKGPGWSQWIVGHFPPGQFGRYLVVGVVNSAFGYGTYAGLTALFTPRVPYAYMLAGAISGFLNITFSFLNYKWFIFKTKGNHLREWSRCIVVYGSASLAGVALLAPTVFVIRHMTGSDNSAPYIAGALLTGVSVIGSYLGHRNFSFATKLR